MDKWRSKIDALLRLSEDSGATPAEKALAKEKLHELVEKHPEAYNQPEYKARIDNVFYGKDFLELKRSGDTYGSWSGNSIEDALQKMVADYQVRLRRLKTPKLESETDG